MTRAEELKKEALKRYGTHLDREMAFLSGAAYADSHPLNPWKSVKEMPKNVWCYCRDKADERPYLAIIEDTGECFNEDMDVCSPKYFMLIPETPKEDTK